jgi:selenocysteine lyase/cysteine desulfurase
MWSLIRTRRPRTGAAGKITPEPYSAFLRRYPEYASTELIDQMRAREYQYLDAEGHCYLDYTGAGLVADSQLHAHATRIRAHVYGNPHSDSPSSVRSAQLVESTRAEVLRFFNASPDEYVVIFTANATGACHLVGEAFPFQAGSRLLLTLDNHNSVNGIREYARAGGAVTEIASLRSTDLRVPDTAVRAGLARAEPGRPSLFCYPAQSNFTGVQHPLSWIEAAHQRGWQVLLDAAAFAPTNRLDLSRHKPDYVTISWYKMFGYPTGIGTLLARRDALATLRRPWFSGGTLWAASAQGDWHRLASPPGAFEDGTVNYLLIPDVSVGLRWIDQIGLDTVHTRVSCLTGWLLDQLKRLRHANGRPMIQIYGPPDGQRRGATVTFNILDPQGRLVDERLVSQEAAAAMISLRTGCFCNPGAGEAMFRLREGDLRQAGHAVSRQVSTIDEYLDLLGLPVAGGIRVSFGLASNFADAHRFLRWAVSTYRDRTPSHDPLPPRLHC